MKPAKKPARDRVRFFATPAAWRLWLATNHAHATELWVGFHKVGTGKPSITWPESVDEALSFGWIDGLRKSIDETAYKIRFTPRKPTSIWSAVNVRRVAELTKLGLMQPAGLAAFARRREDRTGVYSFDRKEAWALPPEWQARVDRMAYFAARPPWYRRAAIHWVMSAKREETRQRRFDELLRASAEERPVGPLARPGGK
jgi:uncharacterized protein YdeI (YjbR/CyaY-like superfamily)